MKYRNAAHALVAKLTEALSSGSEVVVRGSRTRELLHQRITLDRPLERTIVVPHRGNDIFAAIAETVWVIAGRNDVAFLSRYLPRAIDYSDDGLVWRAGYGPRIRSWRGIDQLAALTKLLRADPSSRRGVVSLFDPECDFAPSLDIPCTNWIHAIVRDGELDLAIAVRSNDLMWGFSGINTFEWSVLQEMLAVWVGVRPGRIHYFIGSLHVYERHWDRAARIVEMTALSDVIPPAEARVVFSTQFEDLDAVLQGWFALEESLWRGRPASDELESFSDPLLRDFLYMLDARWCAERGDPQGADAALGMVRDANLVLAARTQLGLEVAGKSAATTAVRDLVCEIHRDKAAMYGDSWKRRGEQMSILANLARKHDRLRRWHGDGGRTIGSEPIFDTVLDLAIYAIKYSTWIRDQLGVRPPLGAASWSDGVVGFEYVVSGLPNSAPTSTLADELVHAFGAFEAVERSIEDDATLAVRAPLVDALVEAAWNSLRLVPAMSLYGVVSAAEH